MTFVTNVKCYSILRMIDFDKFVHELKASSQMEAHVVDMAFYLPNYQYPILYFVSSYEGLASIA